MDGDGDGDVWIPTCRVNHQKNVKHERQSHQMYRSSQWDRQRGKLASLEVRIKKKRTKICLTRIFLKQ